MIRIVFALLCVLSVILNPITGETCKTLETDVTENERSFESHGRYGNEDYGDNEDKCWIIESDVQIKLTVEDFVLQGQDADGNCVDYIKVYDDDQDNDDKKRLGTFCGREPFGSLISRGKRMRINFVTNGDGVLAEGFELKYQLHGTSGVDPGAYWKAGIIFLFIFVFVIAAAVIAVCAAFYTQKKLKPKVILVKKLRGKSAQGGRNDVAKFDITGKPTPAGHVYPTPIHGGSNQVHPAGDFGIIQNDQPMSSSPTEPNPPPFNGPHGFGGPGVMEQNEPMASSLAQQPRTRPATASHIRFEDQS